MYYIQYEVTPAPDSEHFSSVGGAFVNCFVAADSVEKATELALQNFKDNGWLVLGIEEEPVFAERDDYLDQPEWLKWFDLAVAEGECYVFNEWPVEAQEDDEIH
ncbi:MAG: hypothetical protein KF892_24355 [Rhizobacter sp.]|nr:hypothetical protein [Rhizobacter sp.]